MKELSPRERLTQLERQLDEKPRPKSKAGLRKRYALMAEIHELRGIVRSMEIAEGSRPAASRA